MNVIETERLSLRRLSPDDAPFILQLLNEPSFLTFVGDKGVRSLDEARGYIESGPMASYDRHGFGLFLVVLKGDPGRSEDLRHESAEDLRHEDGVAIGICGLVKRDALDAPDVGFAFLPAFWGHGYALESAAAVLAYARDTLALTRILAITNPDNVRSIALLEKLGLRFSRMTRVAEKGEDLKLFVLDTICQP